MDITVLPEVEDLAGRTRDFIGDVVIPVEEEVGGSVHAAIGRRAISQRRRAIEGGVRPRRRRGKEAAS
jgi:hypothetical protein